MKLLFVADGRSPTALNWIRYFAAQGQGVHLVSMYPCQPDFPLASLTVIPVAFSGAVALGDPGVKPATPISRIQGQVARWAATPTLRDWLRHRFVPRSLPRAAERLDDLVESLQPDLVHAMRIPYEGMLAALAYSKRPGLKPPLVVSVWGNDFSLHAPTTRQMTHLTRLALANASALHTDCVKDQRLAYTWGFDPHKPAVVLPGGGGIQLQTFTPPGNPPGPVVINPRGLRAYIRNDTFFQAIPRVLQRYPQARFICPAMAGQPEAESWVTRLGIAEAVDLLPRRQRHQMADLYRQAQVAVSPAIHDGTPNTLLEAMACGCTPVAGDLESLREWITPGLNGLLVDPADPAALADAICEVLGDEDLRRRARAYNLDLVHTRAAYGPVMQKATEFYQQLVKSETAHQV